MRAGPGVSRSASDAITPLWPTWVGQLDLPGAEAPNRALEALSLGTAADGNLFLREDDALRWLRSWVERAMGQWFERMRVAPIPRWSLSGRIDALGFGHYRELGNEAGAYLAGMYFVNAPSPPELEGLRSDGRPSHLTLYDPRVGFNALALEGDPNLDETRTLAPVPGRLMLWPGYLRHCSRVHLARKPWVRVLLRVDLVAAPGSREPA